MDIYTFTDEDKRVESANDLVVSFSFDSQVDKENAIKQIEDLVSLADNNHEITFNSYTFDMYVLSPKDEDYG